MIYLSRRELLKQISLGAASLPFLQFLTPQFSFGASQTNLQGKNLIMLNLDGGYDPLTVFPYLRDPSVGNQANGFVDWLRAVRPALMTLPQDNLLTPTRSFLANDYLGFHPGLAAIYPEWVAGNIRLFQRIGVAGISNGSHNFCSNAMTFGTKDFIGSSQRAWFARVIEEMGLVENQAFGFGTLGRSDFNTGNPALAPVVGARTEDLTWSEALPWPDPLLERRRDLNFDTARELLAVSDPEGLAQQKIKAGMLRSFSTAQLMEDINTATNPGGPKALVGSYSNAGIGQTMKSISRIIQYFGNAKNMLFYANLAGLDTHSSQGGTNLQTGLPQGNLPTVIANTGAALRALIDDLKNPQRYAWDKTVIIMFSEFGRTAKQNGGFGTDHGAGSIYMAIGGPVVGGVIGNPPSKSQMESLNFFTTEIAFQNLFGAAVRWFGCDDTRIFNPAAYTRDNAVYNGTFRA